MLYNYVLSSHKKENVIFYQIKEAIFETQIWPQCSQVNADARIWNLLKLSLWVKMLLSKHFRYENKIQWDIFFWDKISDQL